MSEHEERARRPAQVGSRDHAPLLLLFETNLNFDNE
jgi:hypothetical protein